MTDSIHLLFLLVFCVCGIQPAVSDEGCIDNTTTLEDKFTGQLKFCKRSWGAVCSLDSDHFTPVDSQVVCYELGYSGDGADFTIGNNKIPNNYFVLAHVHCRGDEERLSECPSKIITDNERYRCKSTHESVYVTCPKESQVRLHNYRDNKLRDYRGVVEHYYNGNWYILCDTGKWTWNDARVVCQQLGLGNVVELGPFKADNGSLGYLQNSIDCQNNEAMIRNCRSENTWDVSSTCGGIQASAKCEGPVVQNITINSSTSESVTLSWNLPSNFNKAVVTKFRVEYWPEGHQSQKRCFDQSSNFSYATLDFLEPNTTYEMVIVPMMGEHPGRNSTTHSVKTGENPVIVGLKGEIKELEGANIGLKGDKKVLEGFTIGLSCVLVGIIIIGIAFILKKIGHFIRGRRRHGYRIIPDGNGGCFYNCMLCFHCDNNDNQPVRVNGDVYFDAHDGR